MTFPLPRLRTAAAAVLLFLPSAPSWGQTTQPATQPATEPAGATAKTYEPMSAGTTSLPARTDHRPVPAITHVVIVSIDGCRPDLLLRGDTPVMHAMLDRGSFTMWARTTAESVTLPSHVSMVTGVQPTKHGIHQPTKHGIQWNADLPLEHPIYPAYPTLFTLAHRAGYTTAMAAGKSKFDALNVPGTIDHVFLPTLPKRAPDAPDAADKPDPYATDAPSHATTKPDGSAKGDGGEPNRTGKVDLVDNNDDVTDAAVGFELQFQPGILYVHLPSTDNTGHAKGWASKEQMQAISGADACIGRIIKAVDDAKLTDSTAFIITADHGGFGRVHGPDDVRCRYIPWICFGPGIRKNLDLTTLDLTVSGSDGIDTEDTFCTACYLMNIPIVRKVDGKPLVQIVDRNELLQGR